MDWIFLALGAALLWGIGNIISKYSLSKLNKETTMIAMLVSSFVTLVVLFFGFPLQFSYLPLFSGMIWYLAYYLFFVGLDSSEVSSASALLLTNPIFTAIFSAFILNEILLPIQYLGILLAVLGSLLLTFEGKLKKSALLVVFSSILFSLCDVISKIALHTIDPISTLFWRHGRNNH